MVPSFLQFLKTTKESLCRQHVGVGRPADAVRTEVLLLGRRLLLVLRHPSRLRRLLHLLGLLRKSFGKETSNVRRLRGGHELNCDLRFVRS